MNTINFAKMNVISGYSEEIIFLVSVCMRCL